MTTRALFLIILLALCLLLPSGAGADMYGQADVNYQKTTTTSNSRSTETASLVNSYTLGVNKAITNTINISADARITDTDIDGKKSQTMYPMVTLSYSPPTMYYFNFSYTRTDVSPSESDRLSTTNLNTAFSLPLERYPSLNVFMNRSANQDYLDPHKVDRSTVSYGFNSSYSLTLLDTDAGFNYSFNNQTTNDKVGQIMTEVPTHSATMNLSRPFLDRKLRAGVNAGYNWSEFTTTSLGVPTRFEQALARNAGLFADDATPLVGALASTPALIDNNTAVSAGIDISATANRNVGFGFVAAQSVHKINLYVTTADPSIGTYAGLFGFQLYTSSDGTTWTLGPALQVGYDSVFSRFVMSFSEVSATYFKVVNTAFPTGAMAINVTEIEGLGYISSTPTLVTKYSVSRRFAGFSLNYAPVERVTASYNLNYDHSAQELNDASSSTMTQALNLNITALPRYLTITGGYANTSSSATQTTGTQTNSESGTDTYTLSLAATPLPTLNASMNFGHFVNSVNGAASSSTNNYGTAMFMNLYRGIDVGVGSSMSATENMASNSTTDTTNHYLNLNLTPWKTMKVLVSTSMADSSTESGGQSTSTSSRSTTASASYTPTRKIYLSATMSIAPVQSNSFVLTWVPSTALQGNVRYGFGQDSTNMGATLSWTPLTRFSVIAGYNRTETSSSGSNNQSSSFYARASLRF
ncbi:MAG: hypothetical protein HY886_05655 [Deltaproteobacteria bacterium]|nr:hypothetical protein [Deltaproteobacteria bacterium]